MRLPLIQPFSQKPRTPTVAKVPNRPLRGCRGRLGTLFKLLECGIFRRMAVWPGNAAFLGVSGAPPPSFHRTQPPSWPIGELTAPCPDLFSERGAEAGNMVTERHQKQPQMRGIGSNEAASRIDTRRCARDQPLPPETGLLQLRKLPLSQSKEKTDKMRATCTLPRPWR